MTTTADSTGRSQVGRPAQLSSGQQRRYLRRLIKEASRGQSDRVRTLMGPFVSEDEQFLSSGITARMGLIPRYNFYFLTDRRVGDLEVTPLTGNLNVEMAYLHKIDALVIRQPSIILLRIVFAILYALIVVSAAVTTISAVDEWTIALTVAAAGLALMILRFVVYPVVRRIVLRFRKSGMVLKLTGSAGATFLFADRSKMSTLAELSRRIANLKRQLDLAAG